MLVTQRSSDGGIDLEAIRYGVGGLAGADSVEYYVQAKRNKPGTTIPIEKVRALRGVTELYKGSGLIAEDGSYNPCKAIWKYSEEKIEIVIKER